MQLIIEDKSAELILIKNIYMNWLQDALAAIKGGRIPPPGSMPSFEEIKEILGFNNYYEEEKRYSSNSSQLSSERCE